MTTFPSDTKITLDVAVFRDITPSSQYVNRRFGEIYRLHFRLENQQRGKSWCSRWVGKILKMEVILSSETSHYISATRRYIQEGDNIRYYSHENLRIF
jgi:hypothetical protein